MTEIWVPGVHRQFLNIDRLNTNMENSNFKGFAKIKALDSLNFGWGSIQEWDCIQVDMVESDPKKTAQTFCTNMSIQTIKVQI